MTESQDFTLAFLLAFDGRVHWYSEGYFVKFEVRRVGPTTERPHGLRYSFTLHAPSGKRILGFDNAHGVAHPGSPFVERQAEADHWHRGENDPGRPYSFRDAATLVEDFLNEVRRVLESRGISVEVVGDGAKEDGDD